MSIAPSQIIEPLILKQDIDRFEIYHINDEKCTPFKVLPLGVLQIFFQLKRSVFHNTSFSNGWEKRPQAFIAGPYNKGYTMKVQNGTELFSVKLLPGRYHNYFTCPIHQFKNELIGLDEFWGSAGRELEDQVFNADDHQQRCCLVENFLAARYLNLKSSPVELAAQLMSDFRKKCEIKNVAASVNLSLAQFRRRFRNEIGLSPKEFQRVRRIVAVQKQLEKNSTLSFTQLAYRFHYYDQSHFIHDFQAVTGVTPTLYFSS